MSAFRTKLLGLTALATLFAGASYGQISVCIGGTGAGQPCASTVAAPASAGSFQGGLNLRAEGTTEIVSTVQFSIQNSGAAATGSVNVTFSAPVTSLAIPGSFPPVTNATLQIPGLVSAGNPLGTINGSIGGGGQTVSFSLPSTFTFPAGAAGAPSTTIATVYGVRVNANAVAAASGLVAVTATPTVTSNNSSAVLPASQVPTVGFVSPSLSIPLGVTGVISSTNPLPSGIPPTGPTNYNTAQGNPAKPTMPPSFYISIGDSTSGAFKPWGGAAAANAAGTGGAPGASANYAFENADGNASYGTRVQLAFGNVPTGVTLYVPMSVTVSGCGAAGLGGGCAGVPLNYSYTLALVTSATSADTTGAGGTVVPAPTPPPSFSAPNPSNVSYNQAFGPSTTSTTYSGGGFTAGAFPLTATGGAATAVYEVVNAPTTLKVSAQIPVYVTFAPASVSTASGAITILESYAPSGAVAAATTDPDFAAVTTGAVNGSSITIAQTQLLFPFVTSNAGFDTGIAISNTTTDPFGSSPATGTCTLNFYGSGAPTPNTGVAAPGGTQASGTSNAFLLSSVAPNFAGYMIAVCNYPDGHGFGYIIYNFGQNSGATMGYLATVMARGPGFPVNATEGLSQ